MAKMEEKEKFEKMNKITQEAANNFIETPNFEQYFDNEARGASQYEKL